MKPIRNQNSQPVCKVDKKVGCVIVIPQPCDVVVFDVMNFIRHKPKPLYLIRCLFGRISSLNPNHYRNVIETGYIRMDEEEAG